MLFYCYFPLLNNMFFINCSSSSEESEMSESKIKKGLQKLERDFKAILHMNQKDSIVEAYDKLSDKSPLELGLVLLALTGELEVPINLNEINFDLICEYFKLLKLKGSIPNDSSTSCSSISMSDSEEKNSDFSSEKKFECEKLDDSSSKNDENSIRRYCSSSEEERNIEKDHFKFKKKLINFKIRRESEKIAALILLSAYNFNNIGKNELLSGTILNIHDFIHEFTEKKSLVKIAYHFVSSISKLSRNFGLGFKNRLNLEFYCFYFFNSLLNPNNSPNNVLIEKTKHEIACFFKEGHIAFILKEISENWGGDLQAYYTKSKVFFKNMGIFIENLYSYENFIYEIAIHANLTMNVIILSKVYNLHFIKKLLDLGVANEYIYLGCKLLFSLSAENPDFKSLIGDTSVLFLNLYVKIKELMELELNEQLNGPSETIWKMIKTNLKFCEMYYEEIKKRGGMPNGNQKLIY